jgi:DNA polymerase-3 subunit alpha
VNSIELLDDVREKYIKSLTINVPLKALTEDFVKRVDEMAGEYKGKALLKFNVFDTENNMYIEMFSRTTRVNPLDGFLNFFDEQPEMTYRIN